MASEKFWESTLRIESLSAQLAERNSLLARPFIKTEGSPDAGGDQQLQTAGRQRP